MSILQSKYTNPHSAKIELSCTLCRVNTKSKGKTIQNFYSFCYQTLHLYNKISFVFNFLVKVWVSSGETKIQVFKSYDRNSTSKIATKKKQRSPQKTVTGHNLWKKWIQPLQQTFLRQLQLSYVALYFSFQFIYSTNIHVLATHFYHSVQFLEEKNALQMSRKINIILLHQSKKKSFFFKRH